MRVVTAALDVIDLVRRCAADSASAVRGAAPVPISAQYAHPAGLPVSGQLIASGAGVPAVGWGMQSSAPLYDQGMEIFSAALAALSVCAAIWSVVVARAANARADVANERAKEALDLQHLQDDRAREFRDVVWEASSNRVSDVGEVFTLRNAGLTTARQVSLVVKLAGGERLFEFERVGPGESKGVVTGPEARRDEEADPLWTLTPAYRVHWSSPKGLAAEIAVDAHRLFEARQAD